MTFETATAILVWIFLPPILYVLVRIVQRVSSLDINNAKLWRGQFEENEHLHIAIQEYMPQGVTLQQIKSELGDHLQQHAARDMKQAGTLNTTDYPNLRGPVSPGGKWADLQSETEAIDGDQIV